MVCHYSALDVDFTYTVWCCEYIMAFCKDSYINSMLERSLSLSPQNNIGLKILFYIQNNKDQIHLFLEEKRIILMRWNGTCLPSDEFWLAPNDRSSSEEMDGFVKT